jgi:uncharacterized protein YuzE
VRVTLDRKADAAYVYLTEIDPGAATHTHAIAPTEVGGHMINLDFNNEWRLIGIEVIDASKALPAEVLDTAEAI